MVQDCPHVVNLKRNFAREVLAHRDMLEGDEELFTEAQVRQVAGVILEILAHLEPWERCLLEMLYGLGDGHRYSREDTGDVFQMSHDNLAFEEQRLLRRCGDIIDCIFVW